MDGLDSSTDMELQLSTSTIAGSWSGFGSDLLMYEWAIASSGRVGDSSKSCGKDVRIHPDIQHWTAVDRRQSHAVNSKLSLSPGDTYHVLVRATYRSGAQVTAISNGVLVLDEMPEAIRSRETLNRETTSSNGFDSQSSSTTSPSSCPIDDANRCRQSQQSVADYLNQIYGLPVFSSDNSANYGAFIFGSAQERAAVGIAPEEPQKYDDDDGDDDDDDGDLTWVLAPIFFVVLLLILLVLALLVLRCASGERGERPVKEKQETTDIGPIAEIDREAREGVRAGIAAGAASSEVRVEFPDTNIRRLSIDHTDQDLPEAVKESRSPRRKHPIMSSASSSFRDYRSVNQ